MSSFVSESKKKGREQRNEACHAKGHRWLQNKAMMFLGKRQTLQHGIFHGMGWNIPQLEMLAPEQPSPAVHCTHTGEPRAQSGV